MTDPTQADQARAQEVVADWFNQDDSDYPVSQQDKHKYLEKLIVDALASVRAEAVKGERKAILAKFKARYEAFIADRDTMADKCRAEGDMYGWNYYQGSVHGAINMDLNTWEVVGPLTPPSSHANARAKE